MRRASVAACPSHAGLVRRLRTSRLCRQVGPALELHDQDHGRVNRSKTFSWV